MPGFEGVFQEWPSSSNCSSYHLPTKMHLSFAKRPIRNGSEWKHPGAQRGSYIYKDQDHPAHLSRDDLSLVLSSQHCGSLKVSQVTGITYSWERAQVYVVGKPHRNMRQPGEVVCTPWLL